MGFVWAAVAAAERDNSFVNAQYKYIVSVVAHTHSSRNEERTQKSIHIDTKNGFFDDGTGDLF